MCVYNTYRGGYEIIMFLEAVLTILAYVVATWYRTTRPSYIASILSGLLVARCGFLMHMGNHRGQSVHLWLNCIAGFAMSFVGGCHSAWQMEHQVFYFYLFFILLYLNEFLHPKGLISKFYFDHVYILYALSASETGRNGPYL